MALPRSGDTVAPAFEADVAVEVAGTVSVNDNAALTVATEVKLPSKQVRRTAKINVGAAIAFSEIKDALDTNTVSSLSMAAPRVTAEQGAVVLNRSEEIGKSAVIEPLSWNHRWAIGTGTNDKEAADHFRVSYDNKTIHGTGELISDYIDRLKEVGYGDANCSPYIDLWAYLVTKNDVEIPIESRQIVLVQLSQTSAGNFTSFCLSRGVMEAAGRLPQCDRVRITAKSQQNKAGDRYSNFLFEAA